MHKILMIVFSALINMGFVFAGNSLETEDMRVQSDSGFGFVCCLETSWDNPNAWAKESTVPYLLRNK